MLRALLVAIALIVAVPAAAAVDKPAVERAFQTWIDHDLWPEAKAAGVSRTTFDTAFRGVALDWSMPELQPPGAPPVLPPNTAQAEFQDPGAYFRESILQRLVLAGRQKLQTWQKPLGISRQGATDTVWKNRLKEIAQQRYPQLKVTHAVADALLIMGYGLSVETGHQYT